MPRKYNPLVQPNPKRWLRTGESERLQLALDYHQTVGTELPNERIHAAIHVVVENQVAMGDATPVEKTLGRLFSEGLDRHNAIHAIGTVLARHLWELLSGDEIVTTDLSETYFEGVRNLTAQKWMDEHGEVE